MDVDLHLELEFIQLLLQGRGISSAPSAVFTHYLMDFILLAEVGTSTLYRNFRFGVIQWGAQRQRLPWSQHS